MIDMETQMSKGLRITILIYTIYSIVYGLLHVITPETMKAVDPAIERVLGAAVVSFAIGAGLAYFEKAWDKVRIVVLMQMVWMILYTITLGWGILSGGVTPDAWPPTIIGAIFALLFIYFYFREEKLNQQV